MLNASKNIFARQPNNPSLSEQGDTKAGHRRNDDFLVRLQRGDQQAWQQLSDEWGKKLHKYLQAKLPTREDAEDVLNETMLGTVNGIKNFDGAVALSTFIYSIANRKVVDFYRKRKDVTELSDQIPVGSSLGSESIEFQEALAKLPENSREVLILRYHVGLSVSEAAEVLGRSYKGTESLLSRSRRQLREVLESDK